MDLSNLYLLILADIRDYQVINLLTIYSLSNYEDTILKYKELLTAGKGLFSSSIEC